jgi:LPS sulfotransferase NodH/glycosyltransferase involved in cell wall biosynthesis
MTSLADMPEPEIGSDGMHAASEVVAHVRTERRRRICLVTVEFHGLFKNGGIGTANTALALALAANGFDVTVAVANSDESGPRLKMGDFAELRTYWRDRGITLDYVRPHAHIARSFDDPRTASYCVFLYVQNGGFDVVIFNDNGGQGYYSLLAKHTGVFENPPLLCVVSHGPIDWVHELNDLEFYSHQPVAMSYQERRSAALADVLVSPSRYLLDWMTERGWMPRGGGRVIQNLVGIDPADVPEFDTATRAAVQEIVFFGRQETRKGVTLFCDAIDLLGQNMDLSSVRITFLGKFSRIGAMHSGIYVAERSRRWRASSRILAVYDQTEALDYLRRPGVLAVIPSRAENSPCVVAECLQLGLLFLATDSGGTAELVAAEDRLGCLFSPDPRTLAGRLEDVLHHGHRRARMAVPPQETLAHWLSLLSAPARDEGLAAQGCTGDLRESVSAGSASSCVSICLVWSKAPAFSACLDSLRRQTHGRREIIIAADAAAWDAEMPRIADEPGLSVIFGAYENAGAARNAAAGHAAGDYLLFVDELRTTLVPHAVDTLAGAARCTGADILTALPVLDDLGSQARQSESDWRLPLGACVELGAVENCFGSGALLVKSAYFAASPKFASDCSDDVVDWVFLAGAVLDGAVLEMVPLPIIEVGRQTLALDDGESTMRDHRRILECYRGAPIDNIRRITESALRAPQQNLKKMQRALRDIRKPARDIAVRLAALEPNSADAARLFVQYCCERRMVELALDYALHNDVPYLPEVITEARRVNETSALELMRVRHADVRHSIDLTPEVRQRARPFYRLRDDDLRRTADGCLEQFVPSGDCIIKIVGGCPPGTSSIRLRASTVAAAAVRVAAVVCRSWAHPRVSQEGMVSDGSAWWSGWVEIPRPNAHADLSIQLPDPIAELADLYLITHRNHAVSSTEPALRWTAFTAEVCLIGDISPSTIEMATTVTLLSSEHLKRGRLLTDVSDIRFPIFVPGESSLLHPLPDRLVLALVPDVLQKGACGVRCVFSVEHAQAHAIEFAFWLAPSSTPLTTAAELSAAAIFSGWASVDVPFVRNSMTLQLPGPAVEPMDMYLATRVVDAKDAYFCHAHWHEFAILEEPGDQPASQRSRNSRPDALPEVRTAEPTTPMPSSIPRPDPSARTIRRSYLICAAARTGSNLLANALRDTNLAGWPLEYFNAQSMNDAYMLRRLGISGGFADLPDFAGRLDHIMRSGTVGGIFGATLHWWDLEHLLDAVARTLLRTIPREGHAPDGLRSCFPNLGYIWLRRENKVAQAISHYIAIKSGVWSKPSDGTGTGTRPRVDIAYDFAAIREAVVSAEVEDAGWRRFLAGSEDETLTLTYEELAADYAAVVSRVLAFIGITLPQFAVPPPAFQRQADARSLEWERRYREEERVSARSA